MIKHHFSDNLYAKEAIFPAGSILVQHKHHYDHLSILAKGSVELVVDGETSVLHGPCALNIAAHKHHGVKALTDVVWYCIHSTDCTDVDEIDEILIEPGEMSDMQEIIGEMQ